MTRWWTTYRACFVFCGGHFEVWVCGGHFFEVWDGIGGFRGGAEGATAPPFFLVFSKRFTILLWKSFIKCPFTLSPETLTLLNFTSRIRPQCCMLHVLKSKVFIRGRGGIGPLFLNFLDPPLDGVENSVQQAPSDFRNFSSRAHTGRPLVK